MNDDTLFNGGTEPADLVGYGPIPAQTARDIATHGAHDADAEDEAEDFDSDADADADGDADSADADADAPRATGRAGRAARAAVPRWIRRLYADPDTRRLVKMESGRRMFTPAQRKFIVIRDQICRTPYCDAPIRHIDHVRAHDEGGPTAEYNGQGYCQACNHARQAPDWHLQADPEGAGTEVVITTPTGHRYRSRPPEPPRAPAPARPPEPIPMDVIRAA